MVKKKVSSSTKAPSKKDIDKQLQKPKVSKKPAIKKAKPIKKKVSKPVKTETISTSDEQILSQSFELIKELNNQVSIVEQSKNKLEQEIKLLNQKISIKEENNQPKAQETSSLKKEIAKEFEAILSKFNIRSLKVDMFKELESSIENELSKFESKLNLETSKSHKEINNKFSQIELRIIDYLKSNEEIKKQLKNINSTKYEISPKELGEINLIKTRLVEIDTQNQKLKDLINSAKQEIESFNSEKIGIEDFVVKKTNEVIDKVNAIDKKVEIVENKNEKKLNEEIYKEIKLIKETFQKNIEEKFEGELSNNVESFKLEISKLTKNYVTELDQELNLLKKNKEEILSKTNNVEGKVENLIKEKRAESDFITKRANQIIESFNFLSEENKKDTNKIKKELQKEIDQNVAKAVLSINELKTRVVFESKEERRSFSEDIETKLVNSKKQYDEIFKANLNNFDETLKSKESEFLKKLLVFDDEKKKVLAELEVYKMQISKLTKEYVNKLDDELKQIKVEEANFKKQEEEIVKNIDDISKDKLHHLETQALMFEKKFVNMLNTQEETFDRHENTFREVFYDKVKNLQDYTDKKLEQLERRVVEKNVKIIDDKITAGVAEMELFEEKINSKSQEIFAKVEEQESREENFFENLESRQHNLNEGYEERIISLEKSLNKRFLDYDSDFSVLKTGLIDEVEELMRDVNKVVAEKINIVNNNLNKLTSINNQAQTRLENLSKEESIINPQLQDIRDEVSDLKVKLEITQPEVHSMNDHVLYMSEYESQLLALIDNLKSKGFENEHIRNILVKKGHPKFYISMILENYTSVYN